MFYIALLLSSANPFDSLLQLPDHYLIITCLVCNDQVMIR